VKSGAKDPDDMGRRIPGGLRDRRRGKAEALSAINDFSFDVTVRAHRLYCD
jgi:hypothetical protein